MIRILRPLRTTIVMAALVAAITTLTPAAPAAAINPPQSTAHGVATIQMRWYGGANDFWSRTFTAWGRSYRAPALYYYNSVTRVHLATPCGSTATRPNNGFYCPTSHAIYLDYPHMQSLLNRYGDYAVGGFVAHEFGHAINTLLGYSIATYKGEYHADCLTGMATRWGYATGRLTGTDYGEFNNWLLGQPTTATHGYGSHRSAWYRYGYQSYNLTSCNQVWR